MTLSDLVIRGIALIAAIVEEVSNAHAGTLTPEQALDRIAARHAEILGNRAARDHELEARFPNDPGLPET